MILDFFWAVPAVPKIFPQCVAGMPGYTDRARSYLRFAAENERSAHATYDPKIKAMLLKVADQYRELARQIDEGEERRSHPPPKIELK